MVNMWLHLVTLAVLCVREGEGSKQDSTVIDGAFGTPIVEAVVDRIRTRCIFSDDRLFLKRSAYVTSRDGTASDTYRDGFHGGIWKVNKTMFEATRDCRNPLIAKACDVISNSTLDVDWSSDVTWSDLRKPLYSGLAAALYTLLALNGTAMPGNTMGQGELWGQMYGRDSAVFVNLSDHAMSIECHDKLDLVFILDSSGSVSYQDFDLVKSFAADVVDVMNVSPDEVRVANVVYGTGVNVVFDFDDHMAKDSVKAAFLTTPKDDQGTDTALALNKTTSLLYDYDAGSGARREAKKVAVLVTDGHSNDFKDTVRKAGVLQNLGTTVFAVGVGGYDRKEINAVASHPTCSHVFTLTSFDHILSILTEIQNSACDAKFKLTETAPIKGEVTGNHTQEVNTEAKAPSGNKTIEAEVTCAILDIYVSGSDTNPGPAVFDERYFSLPEAPAILSFVGTLPESTPVYVTMVATRLPDSAAELLNCKSKNGSWTLTITDKRDITVLCEVNGGAKRPCTDGDDVDCDDLTHMCQENNVTRQCTRSDVIRAGVCGPETALKMVLDNPCTQDNNQPSKIRRHRYPYDPTRYIQCRDGGTDYDVLPCYNNTFFNLDTRACGFTRPDTDTPSAGVAGLGATYPKFMVKFMLLVLLQLTMLTMG